VVREQDYLAVLLGSGDREHPFEDAVQNRFYMVKDTSTFTTTITDTDLLNVSSTPTGVDKSLVVNGWYFNLRTGEKTVGNAITLDGVTYFNTNERGEAARDASGNIVSCVGNLGIAREYFVNFRDGSVVTTLMNTRDAAVDSCHHRFPSRLSMARVIPGRVSVACVQKT
jgi:type IV pilus assembly protein PilY1